MLKASLVPVSKTEDILNYPQRQRASQKRKNAHLPGPSSTRGSCVEAARKVSPDWSQKTMTCHSFNCFSIGDFSSEQLLHDPQEDLTSTPCN